MDGGAIKAGEAYVRIYADDAELRRSLATTPAMIQAAATRVTAAATAGNAAMTAATQSHTIAVTAAATRSTMFHRATSTATTVASAGYQAATGSVTGMTVAIGAAAAATKALGLEATVVGTIVNGVLNNSGKSGLAGALTRMMGGLTGSQTLMQLGTQLGRVSIGGAIVNGFQKAGLRGALSAFLRTSLQSAAVSAATVSLAGVRKALMLPFTLPVAAVRRTFAAFSGLRTLTARAVTGLAALGGKAVSILPGLGALSARSAAVTASIAGTSVAAAAIAGPVLTAGIAVTALAKRFAGLGVAAVAAAVFAGKEFANMAADITAKAKETGKSIRDVTIEVYGTRLAGALISTQDIASGKALSTVMKELAGVTSVAWAQIGAAVAPVLSEYFAQTMAVIQGVALWLNTNRDLVASAFRLGFMVTMATTAVGALVGTLYLVGPAVALIASPLGLLAVAITAGVAAWGLWADTSSGALAETAWQANVLYETVNSTIAGIVDALAAGDLGLAAEVGLAGVDLAFLKVSQGIKGYWTNLTYEIAGLFLDWSESARSSAGDSERTWIEWVNSVVASIENGFTQAWAVVNSWYSRVKQLLGLVTEEQMKLEQKAVAKTAEKTIADRNARTEIENKAFRNNPREVAANLDQDRKNELERQRKEVEDRQKEAEDRLQKARDAAAAKRREVEGRFAGIQGPENTARANTLITAGFGAASAGRSGVGGIKKLEDLTKQVAQNTQDTNELLRQNLAFAN